MAWPLLEYEDTYSPLVNNLISYSIIKPSGLVRSCTPVQMNQTLWTAPKGRIYAPKDKIHIPKDELYITKFILYYLNYMIYSPKEMINIPKYRIHIPKERIHTPKDRTHTPKERIYIPKERIYIPKERIYIPKERIHIPKERTHVGPNASPGMDRRLNMTPENFPDEVFPDEICDLGFSSLAEVGEPILCGDAGIDLGLGTLTHVGHNKVKRI